MRLQLILLVQRRARVRVRANPVGWLPASQVRSWTPLHSLHPGGPLGL